MYECGLVLEGGGMRGLYTAGILDFFMEKNLAFSSVYGVSAGCLNGANYMCGQIGRSLATFTDYNGDPRYSGAKYLAKTGNFFNVDFVYDEIPNKLNPVNYGAFKSNPAKFYAVISNIVSGKAEYHHCTDLEKDMLYIRASASLPLLSAPVEIDENKYLDGGICDSIPLARSMAHDNKKNVVILTQCKGFVKQPDSQMPLNSLTYKDYPNFLRALEYRHIMYNSETNLVQQEEKAGNCFVIQPYEPVEIKRLEKDIEKLKALYHKGYEQAKAIYPALLEFLEK